MTNCKQNTWLSVFSLLTGWHPSISHSFSPPACLSHSSVVLLCLSLSFPSIPTLPSSFPLFLPYPPSPSLTPPLPSVPLPPLLFPLCRPERCTEQGEWLQTSDERLHCEWTPASQHAGNHQISAIYNHIPKVRTTSYPARRAIYLVEAGHY